MSVYLTLADKEKRLYFHLKSQRYKENPTQSFSFFVLLWVRDFVPFGTYEKAIRRLKRTISPTRYTIIFLFHFHELRNLQTFLSSFILYNILYQPSILLTKQSLQYIQESIPDLDTVYL